MTRGRAPTAMVLLASTLVSFWLLSVWRQEGQQGVVQTGYADSWENGASSELASYANILASAPNPDPPVSPKVSGNWNSRKVQEELRDASKHDKELSQYQGILSFGDAPSKEHHAKALSVGQENHEDILSFPGLVTRVSARHVQSFHTIETTVLPKRAALARRARTAVVQGGQVAHEVAVTPKAARARSLKQYNLKQEPKTSPNANDQLPQLARHAILVRPPPAGTAAQSNPLAKEWAMVYGEAQQLASKQAGSSATDQRKFPGQAILISPPPQGRAPKANPLAREWTAVYGEAQELAVQQAQLTAARMAQEKGKTQQLSEEENKSHVCSQCKHAWSPDAFSCVRTFCLPASIDEKQLIIDNKLASILAKYLVPSTAGNREIVVSNFVLPADPRISQAWVKVRATPGLTGLGLTSGKTTSLMMEGSQLLSARECRAPGAPAASPSLEDALLPVVKEQARLNSARRAPAGVNHGEIVVLSWLPSEGYLPYESAMPAEKREVAHVVRRVASRPVRADSYEDSKELAHDLAAGDEALEETLIHKQEELDDLMPQQNMRDALSHMETGRAGQRLAGELSELEVLEKEEKSREGADEARRRANADLDAQKAQAVALERRHAALRDVLDHLKQQLHDETHPHWSVEHEEYPVRSNKPKGVPARHDDRMPATAAAHKAEAHSLQTASARSGSFQPKEEKYSATLAQSKKSSGQGTRPVRSAGSKKVSTGAGFEADGVMLSPREVTAVVSESGVLEGVARHAESLALQSAKGGDALQRHRARVLKRELDGVRRGLHTHAVFVQDDARRTDLPLGGRALRAGIAQAIRQAHKLDVGTNSFQSEVGMLARGVPEVAPIEVLVEGKEVGEAGNLPDSAPTPKRVPSKRAAHVRRAPVDSLVQLLRRDEVKKALSFKEIAAKGPKEEQEAQDHPLPALRDVSATGGSEWSEKGMREEGREAEDQELSEDKKKLLRAERVADKQAYLHMLHSKQARKLGDLKEFASAENFASKKVRHSLSRADRVFSSKIQRKEGQDDAVKSAMLAAQKLSKERKAELAAQREARKEKLVAERAAEVRQKEMVKKGYIEGIGYVGGQKKDLRDPLEEMWASDKVPLATAKAQEAMESVPLALSPSMEKGAPSGWSVAAEASTTAEEAGKDFGGALGGALSSITHDQQRIA